MKKETRHSVRVALSFLLTLALVIPGITTASATGPGGWDRLGDGGPLDAMPGTPYVVNSDKPGVLLVGGSFLNAGGKANADHIAKWNGSSWSALGAPALNGPVHAIAVDGPNIYVGGTFTNAGGDPRADYLAVWDGTQWASICTALPHTEPAVAAMVDALEIIGSDLYVGGLFQNAAGMPSADYLVSCDLTSGLPSTTVPDDGDISGPIYTMDSDTNGNLYVGGGFSNLNQDPEMDNVAYLDTLGGWHELGSGGPPADSAVTGFVRSLTTDGTDVYVSTDANNIAGIPEADHVAKWNGSSWSAMGSNTAGGNGWFSTLTYLYGMTTSGSLVFVTGSFQDANGNPRADNVAYFDGTDWHNLGSNGAGNGPWTGEGKSLTMWRGQLYAGGNFGPAGGDPLASRLASFALLRPDALIALTASGPFAGNGVYSATGKGESKTRTVRRGQSGTFFIRIQNDGLSTDAFKVHGTGSARGFSVKYFSGPMDATGAVRAGTLSTGPLAPGDHVTLKMVVKVANSSANIGSFLTKAKSGPNTENDAVKTVVKAN